MQYQDSIHTDAWCICCSQCWKRSSRSVLCMSSPNPLHRLAKQHFDERCKRKQSDSFLSQPAHIIWVLTHRTLTAQYLHLDVFLWKQYIIFASYKDFCKLQSFWLCTPLLALTKSFFLGTYLLKLPSSFVTFVTRWTVSVVIVFSFLGAGFANIPPTFLISCEVQDIKIFWTVHSRSFIR